MFIAIVEDGFIDTKYQSRFEWLKQSKHLSAPPEPPNKADDSQRSILLERKPSVESRSQLSQSYRQSKSIKTLQHIILHEAERWKERKLSVA